MLEELFTRSECCNCRQEIPGVGVECAECHGGKFRICVDCFSLGAEIGQHKREHRYRFFDCGSLSLFPASPAEIVSTKENNGGSNGSRWTAKEEIRLLDSIEQYGFGNWHDTSKHVESKSAAEAKEEFVKRYVHGSVGQISWANKGAGEQVDPDFKKRFPQPIDHTCPPDDGPLSPSLTQRLPPLDISQDEINQLGYMPLRDDYEKEYDNEAEKLVAQLSFSPDDDEVDVGLKLALVDMYSRRLRERARRKRVIRDYQLVSKFFKKDRARSGEAAGVVQVNNKEGTRRFAAFEKKIQDSLRPFAQFYNCREFDHIVRNLIKEKDLKFRIRELLKYRAAGITRVEECVEYEKTRVGPTKRLLGSIDEEDEEDRSFKKQMTQSPVLIQQLLQQNPGCSPLRGQPQEKDGNAGGNAFVNPNPTHQLYYKEDCSSRSSESNGLGAALLPQLLEKGMDLPQLPQVLQGENSFPLNEKQKDMDDRSTVKISPPFLSFDLLTLDERQLCRSIPLTPDQYLSVKTAFYLGTLQTVPTSQDENSLLSHGVTNGDWLKLINFFKSAELSSH